MESPSKLVQQFVQGVCKQIRFKSIHASIVKELTDHIEDQKNEYIDQGLDKDAAELKAVEQMGDPMLVGKQLNLTHRPKTEWTLLSISAVLVVLGGAVQYFFSGINERSDHLFSNFLQYAPIGIAAFLLLYFFDYTWLGRNSKLAYFLLFGLTTAVFLYFDNTMRGTITYVYGFTLLFIPVFAGIVYGFRNKGYLGIIYSAFFYAGAVFICLWGNSAISFLLLTLSCLIILTAAIGKGFFGGNKKLGLAILYVPTLLTFILTICTTTILSPYVQQRIERITAFSNPEREPLGAGYQFLLIRNLFSSAKPIGTAVLDGSFGTQRIDQILPEWSSDFSLTYLIASLGYVPGMALIAVLFVLIVRMFISVLRQKRTLGFLLSFSACLAITVQIVFYILSNIGIFPPLSLRLPFITFGGSGFIVNMALMGLLLSVYRRTNLVSEKEGSEGSPWIHVQIKINFRKRS
ncbi:FtsW/RodA/SpoVE family cell cycle protein [Paenibacillus eucommiae]|uniref:Cell division protein FtsW (Lipid II flippase) n=1 Tax=Paenibacillus eucommiae TaxID=1355755 RepID=A0ABS4IQQ3_9BACL|nr:FtsW/RodA/SpoVE family cell cycle protein [Paenibacillus eucommiae]MBP1989897.1 cell division protein FtsW (lipid II flippase) [Paenibacillus eucommiae]